MGTTPEAKRLSERLRLTRRDIEWLYLDSFEQWFTSDLRTDAEIRPILDECGFSDVLSFAEKAWSDPIEGAAEELRKYVGVGRLKKGRFTKPFGT